ncbi:unnamed protein product [Urochloa humidicola]
MAGAVPRIVVLALGAGALGGPEALRLLIELAGRNPAVDIGICVFVFTIFTAHLLGTVMLARYVHTPPKPGGAGGAPATDPFACIALLMSLAAASLVTACLVVVSGGLGSVRLLVYFATEYYPTVIAAAAGAALLYATPLLRAFREQRNARGGAAPAERATTTHRMAHYIAAVGTLLVAITSGARGRLVAIVLGATLLLLGWRRRFVKMMCHGRRCLHPRTARTLWSAVLPLCMGRPARVW